MKMKMRKFVPYEMGPLVCVLTSNHVPQNLFGQFYAANLVGNPIQFEFSTDYLWIDHSHRRRKKAKNDIMDGRKMSYAYVTSHTYFKILHCKCVMSKIVFFFFFYFIFSLTTQPNVWDRKVKFNKLKICHLHSITVSDTNILFTLEHLKGHSTQPFGLIIVITVAVHTDLAAVCSCDVA